MKLFVYGTLMQHFPNNYILRTSTFISKTEIHYKGKMLASINDAFPAVVDNPDTDPTLHTIKGEVYEVDEHTLITTDRLEGHPNWYRRIKATTIDNQEIEFYAMPYNKDDYFSKIPEVPNGDWFEFCKTKPHYSFLNEEWHKEAVKQEQEISENIDYDSDEEDPCDECEFSEGNEPCPDDCPDKYKAHSIENTPDLHTDLEAEEPQIELQEEEGEIIPGLFNVIHYDIESTGQGGFWNNTVIKADSKEHALEKFNITPAGKYCRRTVELSDITPLRAI